MLSTLPLGLQPVCTGWEGSDYSCATKTNCFSKPYMFREYISEILQWEDFISVDY